MIRIFILIATTIIFLILFPLNKIFFLKNFQKQQSPSSNWKAVSNEIQEQVFWPGTNESMINFFRSKNVIIWMIVIIFAKLSEFVSPNRESSKISSTKYEME